MYIGFWAIFPLPFSTISGCILLKLRNKMFMVRQKHGYVGKPITNIYYLAPLFLLLLLLLLSLHIFLQLWPLFHISTDVANVFTKPVKWLSWFKWKRIKFPFKRKGLTSHNVKFLKCLLENNNGQFKADNKSTILHIFNHSESPSSIWNYNISGLALVTGRFGPHGSFQPNLVRRFGLMFDQSLAVGWGSDSQIWVVRVACGGLIRVGTQIREVSLGGQGNS